MEAGPAAVLSAASAARPGSGGPRRGRRPATPDGRASTGSAGPGRGRHHNPVVHTHHAASAVAERGLPRCRGGAPPGRGEDEQHRREGAVQGRSGVGLLPVAARDTGGVASSARRRAAVGVVALQLGEQASVGHRAVDLHERVGAIAQEHRAVGYQGAGRRGMGDFYLPVGRSAVCAWWKQCRCRPGRGRAHASRSARLWPPAAASRAHPGWPSRPSAAARRRRQLRPGPPGRSTRSCAGRGGPEQPGRPRGGCAARGGDSPLPGGRQQQHLELAGHGQAQPGHDAVRLIGVERSDGGAGADGYSQAA